MSKATEIKLSCSYQVLQNLGIHRSHTELGKQALIKALRGLSKAFNELKEAAKSSDKKNFRKYIVKLGQHCIVIMQMIPEALRFKKMLRFLINIYITGGCPEEYLLSLQNDWKSLSSKFCNLPKLQDLTEEIREKLRVMFDESELYVVHREQIQ